MQQDEQRIRLWRALDGAEYHEIEFRVGLRLFDGMSDAQLEEFDAHRSR